MKKLDYASLYTLRSDGRYMGTYTDDQGKRHCAYDRDPEALWHKLNDPKDTVVTFAAAAEAWKDVRFEQLSYKSVEAYTPVFRRLKDRFGSEALQDIETRDVSAYLSKLAAQGYAKRTVQLYRDMMSQIYNHAIGSGVTRYNPVDHAVMPRNLAAGTRGIASPEAIEAVKAGLDKPFGLFAFVCLYAGLRRGEALALRYEDIDRQEKVIHVTKSVEYVSNNPHIKEPKTKSGKRDVILLDVLADAIPQNKSGYLFPGKDGELLTKESYAQRWEKYCAAIGYKLTAHQLRHGFATMLYEAGIPDKDAQEQLGHANITLTRDVYTHISSKQRSKTAARLNDFVNQDPTSDDEIVEQILQLLEGRDSAKIVAKIVSCL